MGWGRPYRTVRRNSSCIGALQDISTEYGLNLTVQHGWRFGDPHKKTAAPDRHDYDIKLSDGIELSPGPQWHNLYRWIVSQADEFLPFDTVYLITDNRDLLAGTVKQNPGLSHWPVVAAWWKERIKYVGPYGEHTFVPITADTGLERVHPTWAGTYILDACVYLFPGINFALIDSDCVPVTLYEIQELWCSCGDLDHTSAPVVPAHTPTSPIAPAHKRARSVDTGKATQQPGPPAKLPKSRSVENLVSAPLRAPFPGSSDNPGEEVDYGESDEPSPSSPAQAGSISGTSTPTAQPSHNGGAASILQEEGSGQPTKGVILVSEAFTEINAGLVIILARPWEPCCRGRSCWPEPWPWRNSCPNCDSLSRTCGELPSNHQAST